MKTVTQQSFIWIHYLWQTSSKGAKIIMGIPSDIATITAAFGWSPDCVAGKTTWKNKNRVTKGVLLCTVTTNNESKDNTKHWLYLCYNIVVPSWKRDLEQCLVTIRQVQVMLCNDVYSLMQRHTYPKYCITFGLPD